MILAEEWNVSVAGGMVDSAAPTAYRDDEAALILNAWITPDGQAEVRGGSQRLHVAALNGGAQGYGAIQFTTAAGEVQWLAFVGDKAYLSINGGVSWDEIASGLPEAYWSLATMRVGAANMLYAANGGALYSWDGTTWDTVAGAPANLRRIAIHNERLWATDGVRLYASAIADPTTWAAPDGLVLPVTTHDGDDEIVAMFSPGPILMVWKRRSTDYVDGWGNSDVIVAAGARGISRDIGCIAWRTVAPFGRGVIWMSERGFEWWAPGAGDPVLLSARLQAFMASISWQAIRDNPDLPVAVFAARRLTYVCAIPAPGGIQNAYLFCHRLPAPGAALGPISLMTQAAPSGYTLAVDADGYLEVVQDASGNQATIGDGVLGMLSSSAGMNVSIDADGYLGVVQDETAPSVLWVGDRSGEPAAVLAVGYDGFVRALDSGAADDVAYDGSGGVPFSARIRSRPLLFADPGRRKRGRVVRADVASAEAAEIELALVADGVAAAGSARSIPIAIGGLPHAVRVRTSGRGLTLQAEVRMATAGARVSALAVGAELLRERP